MKNLITNNVNKYRVKKNITQHELSLLADTSRVTINKIESYQQLPRVDLAIRIAKNLNTTVEKLFGYE